MYSCDGGLTGLWCSCGLTGSSAAVMEDSLDSRMEDSLDSSAAVMED